MNQSLFKDPQVTNLKRKYNPCNFSNNKYQKFKNIADEIQYIEDKII